MLTIHTTPQSCIEKYIKPALDKLYEKDAALFKPDADGYTLSERCITFRFAHYLQNIFDRMHPNGYFVDCDYNRHAIYRNGRWEYRNGKPILDKESKQIRKRFIDIIVHKRVMNDTLSGEQVDLICFELKKWNNKSVDGIKKDRDNLEAMTRWYGYEYGFHLIFGRRKEDVIIEIFEHGKSIGCVNYRGEKLNN